MRTVVTINTDLLNNEDVRSINQDTKEFEVEFQILETNNFLPSGLILILIEIAQNVGYNAIYDIIKYSLFKVFSAISKKQNKEGIQSKTKISISIDKKNFSLNCNFPLSEEQQEKLINTAIEKLKDLEVNA